MEFEIVPNRAVYRTHQVVPLASSKIISSQDGWVERVWNARDSVSRTARGSRFKAGEVVFAPVAMAICAIVELALFAASWKGQGPQTLAIKPIAPANSLLDKLHPGIDLIGAENNASSLCHR